MASLMLMFAGCSSEDEFTGGGAADTQGAVYATVKLQKPGNRMEMRSVTDPDHDFDGSGNTNSSNGFEIGQDEENNIGSLTLVLATTADEGKTYTPVAVSNSNNHGTSLPSPTQEYDRFTIMFNNKDIVSAAGKEVYVFAFCNVILTFGEAEELFAHTTSVTDLNASIWQANQFMMVNAPNKGLVTTTIPQEESLLHDYSTAEKALDLGTVDVARVAARFDFKNNNGKKVTEGEGEEAKEVGTNIYPVNDATDATKHIADVELVAMAPINVAKKFYTLPRVSADGTATEWTMCGVEKWNNYVVSPNYAEKASALAASDGTLLQWVKDGYLAQMNEGAYSGLDYTVLKDFNGKDDYDENWTADHKEGYKIWRYVTENTIPGIDGMKKAVSTGVVFKAEIKNAEAGPMADAIAAGTAIYAYKGVYYGTLGNLRLVAAKQPENAAIRKDFLKVFGENSLNYTKDETTEGKIVFTGTIEDPTPEKNNGTFKIIRPTNENGVSHYYVYYVYYNRHNDNGDNNRMGIMEFGTVRNNIYKLAVNSISQFGHTDNPGDDPDPENPDEPDEEENLYFKVSCRVLPWMVRVNNIDF